MESFTNITGDGSAKSFEVGFPFISETDIRVTVAGVLKTKGTDYGIADATNRGGRRAVITFNTAPANDAAVQFLRNTPIKVPNKNPTIGPLDALVALYRMQERDEQTRTEQVFINATDLAAGTAAKIVAPCDGYIEKLRTQVTEAVGTGGAITVEVGGAAVTGLSITVANSAAVGAVQEDTPTTAHDASTKVRRGQVITITPAAAFATTGAVLASLVIQPADL